MRRARLAAGTAAVLAVVVAVAVLRPADSPEAPPGTGEPGTTAPVAPSGPPPPAVVVYGGPGTAALVAGDGAGGDGPPATASGQRVVGVDVDGWQVEDGDTFFHLAATGDGRHVVAGSMPFTSNQTQPTSQQMNLHALDLGEDPLRPGDERFTNVRVPTSGEAPTLEPTVVVPPSWRDVSPSAPGDPSAPAPPGADVSDVCAVGQQAVTGISAVPFRVYQATDDGVAVRTSWDERNGPWPLAVRVATEGATAEATDAWTAEDLDAGGAGDGIVAARFHDDVADADRTWWDARKPGECDALPAEDGGDTPGLVIVQYESSGVLVLDPHDGEVLAHWKRPIYGAAEPISFPDGSVAIRPDDPGDPASVPMASWVGMLARDVQVSPVRDGDRYRFTVVYDTLRDGQRLPFAFQELAYDADAGEIVPLSAPVLTTPTTAPVDEQTYATTTAYGADGSLYVAEQRFTSGFEARRISVFAPGSLAEQAPYTCDQPPTCHEVGQTDQQPFRDPVAATDTRRAFGTVVVPDATIDLTTEITYALDEPIVEALAGRSLATRSLHVDEERHQLVAVSATGQLRRFTLHGTPGSSSFRAEPTCDVSLAADRLRAASVVDGREGRFEIRHGALVEGDPDDPDDDRLIVPVQVLPPAGDTAHRPQLIVQVHLAALPSSAPDHPGSCGG